MSITVFAPPKVNLRLLVGPVRADGYHPLRSLMVALDGPADRVTVTRAAERAVRCPGIDGPANLAWTGPRCARGRGGGTAPAARGGYRQGAAVSGRGGWWLKRRRGRSSRRQRTAGSGSRRPNASSAPPRPWGRTCRSSSAAVRSGPPDAVRCWSPHRPRRSSASLSHPVWACPRLRCTRHSMPSPHLRRIPPAHPHRMLRVSGAGAAMTCGQRRAHWHPISPFSVTPLNARVHHRRCSVEAGRRSAGCLPRLQRPMQSPSR